MSLRQSAVDGQFYPHHCHDIQAYIEHFNHILKEADYKTQTPFTPKALVVPHAGYIYSGFTANVAFQTAAQLHENLQTIIVIGPSHRVALKGASVSLYNDYETPCGDISVHLKQAQELQHDYKFLHFLPQAHQEHSTEVQMPFIKHYFPDTPIIEIVYGDCDFHHLAALIKELLDNPNNLIVISTDLSHFYTLKEAHTLDAVCIEALVNRDINRFDQGCEACGIIGLKALLMAAIEKDLNVELLDYRTSFDASGDKERVVGYMSALIG